MTQEILKSIAGKLHYIYDRIGYSSVIPSSHTLLTVSTKSVESFENSFNWGECKTFDTELLNYFETPIKNEWKNNFDWKGWTEDELIYINKWVSDFNKKWIEPSETPKCSTYCCCNLKQELEDYYDGFIDYDGVLN